MINTRHVILRRSAIVVSHSCGDCSLYNVLQAHWVHEVKDVDDEDDTDTNVTNVKITMPPNLVEGHQLPAVSCQLSAKLKRSNHMAAFHTTNFYFFGDNKYWAAAAARCLLCSWFVVGVFLIQSLYVVHSRCPDLHVTPSFCHHPRLRRM